MFRSNPDLMATALVTDEMVDRGTEWPPALLQPLPSGFLASAKRFPDKPALEAAGQTYTYEALSERARSIAATLQSLATTGVSLTAVFGYRTSLVYEGILGALLCGHGYVPLNPRFPAVRNRLFLEKTGARTLVVGEEQEETLPELIGGNSALDVILPTRRTVEDLQTRWPQHRFFGETDLVRSKEWREPEIQLDAIAYVLFTSGSTGDPKGVMITHRNISHLLKTMVARYGMTENDRVSQFADLTFDPSVFDIFAAWECGACVCCPDAKSLLNPAPFLKEKEITIFQSVPSNGLLMKRLGALKPDRFPQLRVSLFGGEALPMELCEAWRVAAPDSILENLYGPSEVTINSTAYRWDDEKSPAECVNGIVPIGPLLPGVRGMVVNESLEPVGDGESGELLLAGLQRSPGYLNDPERTKQASVVPPGESEVYYRTGDSVTKKPASQDYFFEGRIDFQIKVFGMRMELGEIEAALREAAETSEVAAIGWPMTATGVGGVAAFIADKSVNEERLLEVLRSRLPAQMVPREIHAIEELPLNANGKVDRLALRRILEARG